MIWIDKNEDITCSIPQMLKEAGVPVIIRAPADGQPQFDYVINETVCVERKEVSDYFQSKETGHLDKQLYEMSTNFDLSFVVIIGDPLTYTYVNGKTIQEYLGSYLGCQIKQSPEGKQGLVIVNQVNTDEEFVMYLKMLHEKIQIGDFTRLPKFFKATANDDDISIANLCTFKNVGPIRARKMLEQAQTLSNVYSTLLFNPDAYFDGVPHSVQNEIRRILQISYSHMENIK